MEHYAEIIVESFFDSLFCKIFAKTIEFPHKKSVPHNKLAKTLLPAVVQECQLPPRMSRLNN